jgi:hypothetical protein
VFGKTAVCSAPDSTPEDLCGLFGKGWKPVTKSSMVLRVCTAIFLTASAPASAQPAVICEISATSRIFDSRDGFAAYPFEWSALGVGVSFFNFALVGTAHFGPGAAISVNFRQYLADISQEIQPWLEVGVATNAHLLESSFSSLHFGGAFGLTWAITGENGFYLFGSFAFWKRIAGYADILPDFWIALPFGIGLRLPIFKPSG